MEALKITKIRRIKEEDRSAYIEMAKDFYTSDAVFQSIPELNFMVTFDELMKWDRYTVGYILEHENQIAGYALFAKTFSQEAGGIVLWIEELYVKPEYRDKGLGHAFFKHLQDHLPQDVKRVRLEVSSNNKRAASLYQKVGFDYLPYSQMIQSF